MKRKTPAEIGLVMGSDSDWPLLEPVQKTLLTFGLRPEVRVISAHRTPRLAARYAAQAAGRGIKIIIAAAGGAAHLAGVLAAHTSLPVIGVPIRRGELDGLDALLATVQMPAGIPVATMALGTAGPVNAAILAVQILALQRVSLRSKMQQHKKVLQAKVKRGDRQIRSRGEASHA